MSQFYYIFFWLCESSLEICNKDLRTIYETSSLACNNSISVHWDIIDFLSTSRSTGTFLYLTQQFSTVDFRKIGRELVNTYSKCLMSHRSHLTFNVVLDISTLMEPSRVDRCTVPSRSMPDDRMHRSISIDKNVTFLINEHWSIKMLIDRCLINSSTFNTRCRHWMGVLYTDGNAWNCRRQSLSNRLKT